MSKILIEEATAKQVLEYVESVPDDRYAVEHIDRDTLVTDLREALASEAKKPDFWEGYVPEPNSTCSNALRAQGKAYPRTCKKCGLGPCVELAQQALDKKAENARELGLMPYNGGDYEPAQQEPVAWTPIDQPYIPPLLEVLLKAVRADEREQCAKAADDQWVRNPNVSGGDAIRARGQRSDEASLRSNQ